MRAAVRGWSPVIMIDPNARGSCLGDRLPGLVAWRVDDPDQSEVDQLVLDGLDPAPVAVAGKSAVGNGQCAQCQVGQFVDRGQNVGAARGCERADIAGNALVGASTEQDVRGALGDDGDALRPGPRPTESWSSTCGQR